MSFNAACADTPERDCKHNHCLGRAVAATSLRKKDLI